MRFGPLRRVDYVVERKVALQIIEKYKEAWVKKDPEAILKIFTKNGRYHEYVLKKPFIGHKEIRKYWEEKVVATQKSIKFRLLNLYIEEDVAIAECEASFYDIKRKIKIHMKLLMILQIKGGKISYLREYWSSEHLINGKIVDK